MMTLKKISESPTLMTWMSYSTKALTLFGVLPLVLKRFSPGDIVLWYLFATIITMQNLADFGFRQTFSRIISYAFSGAKHIGIFNKSSDNAEISGQKTEPNAELLNSIISTMKYIYLRLTGIMFILMLVFGTYVMVKPIHDAASISDAWWSWIIVLIVSCVSFYGKLYLNFLEGLFKIALVRRIETLTSLGSIITSIAVLFFSPKLINLVIANQIWVLVVTFRDWYLCKTIDNGFYKTVSRPLPFDKKIFKNIWPSAWRSGISGLMSIGLTNATGLIYAQIGTTGAVAAYLLALRIISQIRDISMAPFYSKLPLFAILRAKGDTLNLYKIVKRGMLLSHIVYIIGFFLIGVFSTELLKLLKSDVHFVDARMWTLLGVAFFVHRFGAMHIQVYLSTNHIISHIADGISGTLYVVSSIILSRYIGIYAVPVGMLIGYLGFYAWYAAKHSYRSINTNFFKFEKSTLPIPLIILVVYFLVEFVK
jgi:hypothetical protein